MYNQNQQPFGAVGFGGLNYGDEQWEEVDDEFGGGSEPLPHHHMVWDNVPLATSADDAAFHPERTSQPYIPAPMRTVPETPASTATETSSDQSSSTTYARNGKRLPFIKGGANDAGVEKETGIKGLISHIQSKMGVSATGTITEAQIKSYQKSQGLKEDGVIGKDTYTKLGLPSPYPKSRSGGTRYNPKTDTDLVVGKQPFYKQKWFLYSAIGLAVVGTGLLLFYPTKEK